MKLLCALAAACLCSTALPAGAQALFVKNAKIYTVSGGVVEHGDIVVEAGRIRAAGPGLSAPSGARVIDATGKIVMPGIVDANARFGMPGDDNEQASEVTPDTRAIHLFDPFSREVRRALQGGVTTACLSPGTSNSVGGLCAVVKTAGAARGLALRDAVAEKAALGTDVFTRNQGFRTNGGAVDALTNIYTRRPNSKMGAVWELRHALFQASRSAALSRVMKGGLPLRVHARSENDIRAVLTIADEFKLKRVILDDCVEGYKIPDHIAAHRFAVILGPFYDAQADMPEGTEACLNTAGILSDRGVRVAFGSNGGDPSSLLTWAALANRAGLKSDMALRAITLSAAELAGVAGRVGSIRAGRDADLLILSGEPLDVTSRIETVIVNGQVAYEAK